MATSFLSRWWLVLGMTLVLWVISERIFWSFWRVDDTIGAALLTLVMYGIATYIALYAIEYFRVRTFSAFMLIGALFGWITEGIIAMTVMGGGGIPFPISLSWTGLAWHMLISVGVFLWWHRRVLQQSFWKSLLFSLAIGTGWGVWSMTWFFETPPVVTSFAGYAQHAFILSAFLFLGHFLINRSVSTFLPPWYERGIVFSLLGLFFIFVTIPTLWYVGVIIVLLGVVLYIPLARHRKLALPDTSTVLSELTTPVPIRNLLTIFVAPAVASLIYAGMLVPVFPLFPVNFVVLIVATLAGFVVFGLAWKKTYRATE